MTLSYYTYSVFYTVLNPDLFGHLKDPYTTVFVSILAIYAVLLFKWSLKNTFLCQLEFLPG